MLSFPNKKNKIKYKQCSKLDSRISKLIKINCQIFFYNLIQMRLNKKKYFIRNYKLLFSKQGFIKYKIVVNKLTSLTLLNINLFIQ